MFWGSYNDSTCSLKKKTFSLLQKSSMEDKYTEAKSINAKSKSNEAQPSWTWTWLRWTWLRCTCPPPSATSVQCWREGRQVHRGAAESTLHTSRWSPCPVTDGLDVSTLTFLLLQKGENWLSRVTFWTNLEYKCYEGLRIYNSAQGCLVVHWRSWAFQCSGCPVSTVHLLFKNFFRHHVNCIGAVTSEPTGRSRAALQNAVLSSCDLEDYYKQWPGMIRMVSQNFKPHVWHYPDCWQRSGKISFCKSKLATSFLFALNLGWGILPRNWPIMKTGQRGKNLPVESNVTDGGGSNFWEGRAL